MLRPDGGGGMNILIVEDDSVSRKFMTKFLSRYGTCQAAEDGVRALNMYKKAYEEHHPYDLICMDLIMPNLDGYGTIEKIREYEKEHGIEKQKEAKVIMTSGSDAGTNMSRAFELGCVAYASKPIDVVNFNNILRELRLI